MKLRTYIPTLPPRTSYISEADAFDRTQRAILTLAAVPKGGPAGVRSNWPKHFDFHAEAIRIAMTPGARVENPKIEKAIKKLRAQDFDDINLDGKTVSNMPSAPYREPPSAEAVSDCLVAGEWFAKLALLPENIDQFEHRVEEMRTGKRKSAMVDDQIIVMLYAQGWSLRMIGIRFRWNEDQTERRLFEVARHLFRLANGTARYADLSRIEKLSKERIPA
jgi:hypothetical protein